MVLLLTGAIDIRAYNVPSTTVIDANERLIQYLASIEYAITHYKSISDIVFCENTNFTFDYSQLLGLAHKNAKNLEILTFKGDYTRIQKNGKGFGEGEIIRYALNKSETLRNCEVFFKLTGRLVVKNMDNIVITTKSDNGFIYHPKTIYQIPKDHIETFFYKVNKNLYIKYLLDAYHSVDELSFRYLEHIFYEQLSHLELQSFKIFPLISGNSGTSGEPYDSGMNAMVLEKINYFIGVHNLKKTESEKVFTNLLSNLLKIRRLFK